VIINTLFSSQGHLVKQFGEVIKSYPHYSRFSSEAHEVETIEDLHQVVLQAAANGDCLLKGTLTRDLDDESRAGSTVTTDPTEWVCFDLDKVQYIKTPEEFMTAIGMSDVSYVVQYSSSHGLLYNGEPHDPTLSCHIFVLLNAPTNATHLKQWLIQLNFQIPSLKRGLELTKTDVYLHFGLDITTCQNDKLLYVAPPVLSGPFTRPKKVQPIQLVLKQVPSIALPKDIFTMERSRAVIREHVNELRQAKGLEVRRRDQYKMHDGVEILAAPGACFMSGIRDNGDFVQLNLNNGNSWGYYHPKANFEILYNFKGEPNYKIADLLPDYYADCERAAKRESTERAEAVSSGSIQLEGRSNVQLLAFNDMATGAYRRGFYHTDTNKLELYTAKNETQLRQFVHEHTGIEMCADIPSWDVNYDPHCDDRIDIEGKWLNLYVAPLIVPEKGKVDNTMRLISHILADTDEEKALTNHFVKWLAFIVQNKAKARTSWVIQSVQRTGKGVLFEKVITPILGSANVIMVGNESLLERYNGWLEATLMVGVNEADLNDIVKAKVVGNKLKEWITDPLVRIRDLYKAEKVVKSYTNWIFFSNNHSPVSVERHDGRFNIGNYQETKLEDLLGGKAQQTAFINGIMAEVPAFFWHLLHEVEVTEEEAMTVMVTEAKEYAIEASESDIGAVVTKLRAGDWQYFWEMLPDKSPTGALAQMQLDDYRSTLVGILNRTEGKKGSVNVSRDEIHAIAKYLVPNVRDTTTHSFGRKLSRNGMTLTNVWIDKSVRGLVIKTTTIPKDWNKATEAVTETVTSAVRRVKQTKTA
jgi:hypothetical protein